MLKNVMELQYQTAEDLNSIARSLDTIEQCFIIVTCAMIMVGISKIIDLFLEKN